MHDNYQLYIFIVTRSCGHWSVHVASPTIYITLGITDSFVWKKTWRSIACVAVASSHCMVWRRQSFILWNFLKLRTHCLSRTVWSSGVCSFCCFLAKIFWVSDFVEFVLGRFLPFTINFSISTWLQFAFCCCFGHITITVE